MFGVCEFDNARSGLNWPLYLFRYRNSLCFVIWFNAVGERSATVQLKGTDFDANDKRNLRRQETIGNDPFIDTLLVLRLVSIGILTFNE